WIGPQALFSVGPQIRLPIFNTGRTAAGGTSAEARAEAGVSQYKQTIQQAFREVADALVEQRKRREFRVQQELLTLAAQDTSRLANMRYTGGVSSYLEVLDSERQFFDAELGLVRAHRDELLAVVRLYKALGGGWQEERPVGRAAAAARSGSSLRPLAALGSLPVRASVGHGPRGLQPGRHGLDKLPARSRALARRPLGGGRPGGHLGQPSAALLRAGAVERTRPLPEGAPLRADRAS